MTWIKPAAGRPRSPPETAGLREFLLEVDGVLIAAPRLCSGAKPSTRLHTRFGIDDPANAPATLDVTLAWRSKGKRLRTP